MNDLTIRNMDERTVDALALRAAASGRAIEEEARDILTNAVGGTSGKASRSLVEEIRALVAPTGGFILDVGQREPMREPPGFDR